MAFATSHNAGRSQINLNILQTGGEFPFLNCLKAAQAWGTINNAGPPDPNTLDSDGYPTSITNGGVYTRCFTPTQADRPGDYVLKWDGFGIIYLNSNNTLVSGSLNNKSGGTGRYEFSTTTNDFLIGISDIGATHVTNLRFCHVNDEASLDAGSVFGVKFKQRLAEANFGVIRFLNWQDGNITNVTRWSELKPLTYAFYDGNEFRTSLFCTSAATLSGTAYSVAAPPGWGGLVDKAKVQLRFATAISSACTLNVGGTGNINILSEYASALSSGGNSYPITGTLATLTYDIELNAWIKQGGDVASFDTGIQNCVPPQLCVQLCAEVGAHPHFIMPVLTGWNGNASGVTSDYITTLAAYIRDNYNGDNTKPCPWMVPVFEGPNELWNTAAGFYSTGYGTAIAAAKSWASYNEPYGMWLSMLGQDVNAVYGSPTVSTQTKYHVACGVQTALNGSSSDSRLTSAAFVSGATAPTGYTASAASSWTTTIMVANYWNPDFYNKPAETTLANAWVGTADPQQQQSLLLAYVYSSNVASDNSPFRFTIVSEPPFFASWKTWAQGLGVNRMRCYEGGYSVDFLNQTPQDAFRFASKSINELGGYETAIFYSFTSLTGGSFVAEYPSSYLIGDSPTPAFAWSLFNGTIWSANTPRWNAVVSYNAPVRNTRRMRFHS